MFSVIMSGGSGTRFWPVSRKHRPKQFLNIAGSDPMILETCNRISPLVQDEEIILVLGQAHLKDAQNLFSDRKVHILAEPIGRNTAPCIGLGAVYARHLGHEGPIAFLPADHYIGDPGAFLMALEAAAKLASSGGIVTLGIVPNRPETGYGYIQRDKVSVKLDALTAYNALKFVEKPDLETALNYLKSGEYYWNAGIFVATAETILKETEKLLPPLYDGLSRLEQALGTESFTIEFEKVYEGLEGISFDYGIMERTQEKVFVVPCDCGWSDVGSWSSLYELKSSGCDHNGNVSDENTLLIDCEGSFISSDGKRLVACLGLKNCLVVDTPDAVLLTTLDRSQDIRKIVDELKKLGKEDLL